MSLFPVESPVAQLRPETIARLVEEAEERQWSQLNIPGEGATHDVDVSSQIHGSAELGNALIRHGTSVRKIQTYFSHLESRKCCLLLAGRKSTFSNVRLVRSDGQDGALEEGAMQKSTVKLTKDVQQLDNKEFRAFKHAYLCAAFPVLGAPDPPSPISPSLSSPITPTLSFTTSDLDRRPSTPNSLHDSGVEETDDGAMIPTETLCELLRRAFRLSSEKFHQYESIIAKSYQKKSPPKLLAEELVSQLMALENNSNTFYCPPAFLSRNGYDIWCHKEMSHISDLLTKFWHFSLPLPSDSQSHAKDLTTVHEDYEMLLSKLLLYEHQFKVGADDSTSPLFTLLSSASLRLLREFGLRYGIGEQYRRILYLRHLIEIFSPSVWFLQHVSTVVSSIRDMLPSNKSQLVMTKTEFMLLDSCIKCILVHTTRAFCQMKTIFHTIRPADGIEILIHLISTTIELRGFLFLETHETLDKLLHCAVQGIFRPAYERHKMLSMSELLKKSKQERLCPILINILIGNIRDEVNDYKNNYQAAFAAYLNITEIAAQSFYFLLMEDVDKLCQDQRANRDKDIHEISLLMLGLAYRLNQLDQDWAEYIPIEDQHWRKCFLQEILHWSAAMLAHVQGLILAAIGTDKFQTQEVHLTTPLSSLTGSATPSNRCQSVSAKSLTPSINSAFSSVVSSRRSSPNRQVQTHDFPTTKTQWQPDTIRESLREAGSAIIEDTEDSEGSDEIVRISKRGSFDTKSLITMDEQESRRGRGMMQSLSMPEIKKGDDGGHDDITDSCPFMPLLDESDEISSVMSGEQEQNGQRDDLEGSGSGIVFQVPLHASDDEVTSSVASDDVDTVSEGGDTEPENDQYSFPPIHQVSSNMATSSTNIVFHTDDETGVFTKVAAIFRSRNSDARATNQSYSDQAFQNPRLQTNYAFQGDTKRHNDFLDSFSSEFSFISLPTPPPGCDASLPVSGSAIDVLVIMQRLVFVGRAFYQLLYPSLDDLETLEAVESGDLSLHQLEFFAHSEKGKEQIYSNFLTTIGSLACHFADNMLCLDLCGTTHNSAKRIIGPKMVEHLHNQRRLCLIWGCRHELDGKMNCYEYINKQTAYLCDRYEPVTQQMCTRVNNVSAMLKFLEVYERQLASMFGEKESWLNFDDMQKNRMNARSGRESCFSTQDFVNDNLDQDDAESLYESPRSDSPQVIRLLDPHQSHLLAVLKAQCRLIAYRLNLFIHDAMRLLLKLKPASVTIQDCLKPVTSFLQRYMENLSAWLYKDCFKQLLECLWIFIVQDLEVEGDHLRVDEDISPTWAQTILQALTHLLRFMNNFGQGITRNLLLSQADDLIFKLQLYTLSTHQLLALYSKLRDFSLSERGMFPHEIVKPAPTVILQKIQRDLQKFRKCFSGKELIRWIYRNRELFYKIEPAMVERNQPFSRETAVEIIFKMLDLHCIADLESDVSEDSRSPSPTQTGGRYPDVTIHGQLENMFHHRSQSECESDLTPIASPLLKTSSQSNSSSDSERKTPVSSIRHTTTAQIEHRNTSLKQRSDSNISSDGSSGSSKDKSVTMDTPTNVDCDINCDKDQNGNAHQETSKAVNGQLESSHIYSEHSIEQIRGMPAALNSEDSLPGSQYLSSNELGPKAFPLFLTRPHLLASRSDGMGMSRSTLLTPLSFRSDTPLTSLVDSSNKFFHVVPQAVEDMPHSDCASHALDSYIAENMQRFIKLLRSRETADMVEKCFQQKIKPVFLLSIIYGRRKTDQVARTFVKQLPAKVLDRIRDVIQRPQMDLPN